MVDLAPHLAISSLLVIQRRSGMALCQDECRCCRQMPATAGDRRGQGGQQSAHFDLAGELEPGSGGSLVRGQNVFGKLLALGHQTILPSTRAACLTATRPQAAAAAYPSRPSCGEAPAPPVTTDLPEGGNGDNFPR